MANGNWDDEHNDAIRIWGRYIPDELRHIQDGTQAAGNARFEQAKIEYQHELAVMYLLGVLAKLEGRHEPRAWEGRGGEIPGVGAIDPVPIGQYSAAKKIRDAAVHNGCDLNKNLPGSQPTEAEKQIIRDWPGVSLDETGGCFTVALSPGFIDPLRRMFLTLTEDIENWRN